METYAKSYYIFTSIADRNIAFTKKLGYTGWPRKNATTFIINFKDIVNKTDLFFILLGRKFNFQQNDTMTINFGWGIWILGLF